MKLAIVGPGLIGKSVALAAQRADAGVDIIEIDRGESLNDAADADLIVLAAPVAAILDILQNQSHALRTAVTVDTGSTKKQIVAAARAAGLERFVGGHPMAGGSTSGPAGARAQLFEGRPWFLVAHGALAEAVARVRQFVTMLGAHPVVLEDDGSEHDQVMAAVSHLPQVVATTLVIVAAQAAGQRLAWAGSGLRDTTRLAESSASMWEGVLATNAAELRPLLLELAGSLTELAGELDNPERIRELFAKANRYRALL
jgi:prephenate dehydrogenase